MSVIFNSGVVQADGLRRVGNPSGAGTPARSLNKLHRNALTNR
jgi:hypothetical protein